MEAENPKDTQGIEAEKKKGQANRKPMPGASKKVIKPVNEDI